MNAPRETSAGVSPAILKPVRLVLPYPVSVNDFMRSFVPRGQKRPIPFLTPEARAYKHECAWIAKAAGLTKPTERPIELAFTLHPPATRERFDKSMRKVEVRDGSCMDLDNALKVAIDSLKGSAYVDDRQVKRLSIEYGERCNHGQLVVEINEFVPAAGPLFAGGMGAVEMA